MDAANVNPWLRNVQRSAATDFGWKKRRQDIRASERAQLFIRPFVLPFFLHSSLHPVQIAFDPSLNLLSKDGLLSLDLTHSIRHFMS